MTNDKDTIQQKNLLLLGMMIFTIGTFTLDTFLSSLMVEIGFLIVSIFIIIVYFIIYNKGIVVYKLELMWLVFIAYFMFNILYQSHLSKVFLADIVVLFILFLFLVFVKLDIGYYITAMKVMLVISIVYALSSLFQYFNMDLYAKLILPLFSSSEQHEIMRIYRHGNYTGFTWQTAYISGYLAYGIATLTVFFKEKTKFSRVLTLLVLPLLFIALILGGKRAHLLFMVLSLLITYLFSTNIKRFFSQLLKIILGVISSVIIGVSLLAVYTPSPDTPLGKFYDNIKSTINGFLSGEDITSGRTFLYDHALKLFNETPILGIGWRQFSQQSVGILNNDRGSHPHNIYFQLLTELGLVGFILFMIPIIYLFYKTIRLLMNVELLFDSDMRWKKGLQFSLYSQAFFLLYGITGNLLTDHMYLIMWGFAASITLSAIRYAKKIDLNKHINI